MYPVSTVHPSGTDRRSFCQPWLAVGHACHYNTPQIQTPNGGHGNLCPCRSRGWSGHEWHVKLVLMASWIPLRLRFISRMLINQYILTRRRYRRVAGWCPWSITLDEEIEPRSPFISVLRTPEHSEISRIMHYLERHYSVYPVLCLSLGSIGWSKCRSSDQKTNKVSLRWPYSLSKVKEQWQC